MATVALLCSFLKSSDGLMASGRSRSKGTDWSGCIF